MEVTDKVRIFATLNQKDSMNGDSSERLSQESECREAGQYGILDEASAVALGVLKEIEALAGTTTCKSVQLVKLKNGEYYTNGYHDIFDAVEGNVLMGDDGHIFIDVCLANPLLTT